MQIKTVVTNFTYKQGGKTIGETSPSELRETMKKAVQEWWDSKQDENWNINNQFDGIHYERATERLKTITDSQIEDIIYGRTGTGDISEAALDNFTNWEWVYRVSGFQEPELSSGWYD